MAGFPKELNISQNLNVGDIEIGAVELKDGSTDGRGVVEAPGDGSSNATLGLVTNARLEGFGGTTWDRLKAGITAVTSTLTGWLNVLPWAVYNASPSTRTEGQGGPLQSTPTGELLTAGGNKEVSFTTTTVQAVGTTDVQNYRWVSVHIVTQGGSSTVTFQGSNDNSNWVSVALQQPLAQGGTSAATSTTAAGVIYAGPVQFRYFRLNVTGIASGTTAGVIELFTTPSAVFAPPIGDTNHTINLNQIAGTSALGLADNADGVVASSTTNKIAVMSRGSRFSGTNWEREYGNVDITILASGSRTTTQTSADLLNYNSKGIQVVLDVTSIGTGNITLAINGKDAVSGKYYAILTGAAVSSNSTNVYKIYPGITVAANAAVADFLPRTYQVVVTANNANPVTYSVGASLIN